MYLFSGQVEILCPDRKQFSQNLGNIGLPLKFGPFEYLCLTTLIPFNISCSIVRKSFTVRLSMSRDTLFLGDERLEFALILCLSLCSGDVF